MSAGTEKTSRLRLCLVRHLERVAEELHERRRRPADARVLVEEAWSDDVVLAQASGAKEVLPLQVVREAMFGAGPGRDALERVAAELEPLREGAGSCGAPPA